MNRGHEEGDESYKNIDDVDAVDEFTDDDQRTEQEASPMMYNPNGGQMGSAHMQMQYAQQYPTNQTDESQINEENSLILNNNDAL